MEMHGTQLVADTITDTSAEDQCAQVCLSFMELFTLDSGKHQKKKQSQTHMRTQAQSLTLSRP